MTRPIVVLRPEPGNAATAARLTELGLAVIRLPLFAVVPLAWQPPAAAEFDALLITSANTLRHGGAGLATLRALPVVAVGEATARAAQAAGFGVALTGGEDAAAAVAAAAAAGMRALMHLGGRDRASAAPAGIVRQVVPVYASDPLPITTDQARALGGAVALLHSARAARRLGALIDAAGVPRDTVRIAAISAAVATAAGFGGAAIAVAPQPTDAALIDAARGLAD